ncbi:unnamed protein product [Didymodactylos carnosus]|uniref:Uncharacterized protein n=1 Tax=Didymodactylos carnosus TaxID=1234261 RepID=A0A814DCF0_9BILA|nr:unnamed protein product [Didymodactylos carnosus]CAF0956436.1 unnamed protein product [Didymodactylos carnosus]CAF3725486.1 unnamed protein product [Didymodactylos carnosus]CAF3731415.1 unnamed protein product [Didymodactylos carnosus]
MDSPCRVMVNVGTQAATNNRDLLPLSNEAFLADFTTKSSISDFNYNDNRRYPRSSNETRIEQVTIQQPMGVKPFLAPDPAILQIVRGGSGQQEPLYQPHQFGSLPQQPQHRFSNNNGMFNNRRRLNNGNGYVNNQNLGLLGAGPFQTAPNRPFFNRHPNDMYVDEMNPFQQKNRFQQQQFNNNTYSSVYDNRMNVVDQLLAASRPLPVSFKPQTMNNSQSPQFQQQQTRGFMNRRPMSAQQERFMPMNMQKQQSPLHSAGGYFPINNQRSNRGGGMNRNSGGMCFNRGDDRNNNYPIMRTNYNNSFQDQYYSNNDYDYNYNFDIIPNSAPFRTSYNNNNRRHNNNMNNYQQTNDMGQYWYGSMPHETYQRRWNGRGGAMRGQISRGNRNGGYGRQRGVVIANHRGGGSTRERRGRGAKLNQQQKSTTSTAPNADGTSPLKTAKTSSQQQKRRTKSKRKNRKQRSKDSTEALVCSYVDNLLGQLIVEAVSESLSIKGATTTTDENKKSKTTKTNTTERDTSSSGGDKTKRTGKDDDEKVADTPTENNDEWHDIDKDEETDSSSSSSPTNHSPNITMIERQNSQQRTLDKNNETQPPRDKSKNDDDDNKTSLANEQKQPSISPSASDSSVAVNVGDVSSLACSSPLK